MAFSSNRRSSATNPASWVAVSGSGGVGSTSRSSSNKDRWTRARWARRPRRRGAARSSCASADTSTVGRSSSSSSSDGASTSCPSAGNQALGLADQVTGGIACRRKKSFIAASCRRGSGRARLYRSCSGAPPDGEPPHQPAPRRRMARTPSSTRRCTAGEPARVGASGNSRTISGWRLSSPKTFRATSSSRSSACIVPVGR